MCFSVIFYRLKVLEKRKNRVGTLNPLIPFFQLFLTPIVIFWLRAPTPSFYYMNHSYSEVEVMEISIQELSKVYRSTVALWPSLFFTINTGLVGILGPNGAGKITLLNILATLVEPTRADRFCTNRPDIQVLLSIPYIIQPDFLSSIGLRTNFNPQGSVSLHNMDFTFNSTFMGGLNDMVTEGN